MNLDPHTLSELAAWLGWGILHSLWQGALIAILLALVLTMSRRGSAAGRHLACLFALGAMLAAFCVTLAHTRVEFTARGNQTPTEVRISPPNPIGPELTAPPAIRTPDGVIDEPEFLPPAPEPAEAQNWKEHAAILAPWLGAGWLAGFALLSIWRAGGWMRVRSWRSRGVHAASAEADALFSRLAERLRLRRAVRLLESTRVAVPMVIGALRPVILLPVRVATGLGPRELEAVLAHELAHIVRGDAWANHFQLCVETIFFYHPALWWIARRARAEREDAADDLALAVCAGRRVYASALARLVELGPAPAGALAASGGSLLARIRRIAGAPVRREPAGAAWAVAGMLLAVAFIAARLLPAHAAENAPVIAIAPGESIQAAIDAAPEGAVIRLGEGEWKERIRISKPLTLEGAGWEKTRITIEEPPAAEIAKVAAETNLQSQAATTPEEKAKAAEARVEKVARPAIWVHGTKDVTLRKLRVQGISQRGREDGGTASVLVYFQRAKAAMSECAVVGPFGNGIFIADESEAEISRTLVAALWGEGIVVTGAARDGTSRASRLHLADSDVRNVYHYGIALGRGCDSTVIARCRISGTAWHGIRYDDAAPTITGNSIFAHARCGIYASGKTRATVRGNLFWKNEMDGVSCWFDNADVIEGNTFVGNLREGLGVIGGAKPTVARNIFAGNPAAIICSKTSGRNGQESPVGDPVLTENLYWENPKMIEGRDAPENAMSVDPKFLDPANNKFALAENSPARAANIGVAEPLALESPWPLLEEEKSITPTDTREFSYWTAPGGAKSTKATAQLANQAATDAAGIVGEALQLDDAAKREAAIEKVRAMIESGEPAAQRVGLAAFTRVTPVAFDKASFRPPLRRLLASPEAGIRREALVALGITGASSEDIDRVLAMIDDPSGDVRNALPYVLKQLSAEGFTGRVGEAILKLLDRRDGPVTSAVWHAMWGTPISPELEQRVVAASRTDADGSGYSEVFYYALTVHLSKREPTVTRLIELAASADTTNVAGRCLWGLQQGVVKEQQPRVADFALRVLAARDDGYMRKQALACLRDYGNVAQSEALAELIAKPGVTGELKESLEAVRNVIKPRTDG